MTLYLIIAAAMFAVSAAITFATKTVSNNQFIVLLVAFPLVFFTTGIPLENLGQHLMTGAIMFICGFLAFALLGFGGGTARAFAVTGLWIPGWENFFNFLCVAIIGSLAGSWLLYILSSNRKNHQNLEHYAGVFMSCCAAFMIYVHVGTPKLATQTLKTNSIESVETLTLRGLSSPDRRPN